MIFEPLEIQCIQSFSGSLYKAPQRPTLKNLPKQDPASESFTLVNDLIDVTLGRLSQAEFSLPKNDRITWGLTPSA